MRSVSYWRRYFYAALLSLGLVTQPAQAVEILRDGEFQSAFHLQGLHYNGNLGPVIGEMNGTPSWHISQWGSPLAFQPYMMNYGEAPMDNHWSLSHQWGWIYLQPDYLGSKVTLHQHKGPNTPGIHCRDGLAGEWDLLLEPNDPVAFPAMGPEVGMIPPAQRPHLDQMSSLVVSARVSLDAGWHQDFPCQPGESVGNVVIGVVVHNWEINLGFFYQLMLYDSRGWHHNRWYDYEPGGDRTIFVVDSVEVYGRPPLFVDGHSRKYAVDIRDRVVSWLNENPNVPAHAKNGVGWQVVAYYAGQAVTNTALVRSTWSEVGLNAR